MSLCASCRLRPANHHITNTFPDGHQEHLDLCEDCARKHLPKNVQFQAPSFVGQICQFCAKPATIASSGLGMTMFWCTDCGLEIGEIVQSRYSDLSGVAAPKDSDAWTKKMWHEAAIVMGERIAKRKGPKLG